MSEDCWSPTSPAMGGSPSSAEAVATTPVESTMAGRSARADPQFVEDVVVPVRGVVEDEPRDTGVRGVGDVRRTAGQDPGEVALHGPEAQVV